VIKIIQKLIINGQELKFKEKKPVKLNNEFKSHDTGIINPTEISELQGALQELNNDEIDDRTGLSKIDMRTILHPIEISSILVIDILVQLEMLPQSILPLTMQKKRLNVSQSGTGRNQHVSIVQGRREHEQMTGSLGVGTRLKNFFGGGE